MRCWDDEPGSHYSSSETQLRSRLKKWRVTKPSRQTRKKPQGTDDGDSDKDGKGSSTSPYNRRPSPGRKESSATRSSWVGAYPPYASSDILTTDRQPPKWTESLTQQLTPSPSGEHGLVSERPSVHSFDPSPTATSFEQSAHNSPVTEGLMLNTSAALTSSYAGYPLSPDSCIPSPGSTTTAMPWPARSVSCDMGMNSTLHPAPWYPMPFEPITPPNGLPQSAHMAPPPGYRDHMSMVVPSAPGLFPPEFGPYGEAPEYHQGYDAKPWKRTMSLQYDFASHPSTRPDQVDRKHMQTHGHHPPGMVPMTTQPGPHNGMCAPLVPYMGQNPMVHKQHPGVGY